MSESASPGLRSGLVVTGVLGLGTVLVFAAAALAATLFPNGTMVNAGWNGGWAVPAMGGSDLMPVPMPVLADGEPAIDLPAPPVAVPGG